MQTLTHIIRKRKITFYGLLCGVLFAAMCYCASLREGALVFFLLYLPGVFFGTFMFFALRDDTGSGAHAGLIVPLSTVLFLAMIAFVSKNFEFLMAPRRILMGGIGAVLFIGSCHFIFKFPFKITDYLLAFIAGLITALPMWTSAFESIDLKMTIISILLWQTCVAFIVDLRAVKPEQRKNETSISLPS